MDFRVTLYFVLVFEFLVVPRCELIRNQGQLFVYTELRIRHFCNDQMLKIINEILILIYQMIKIFFIKYLSKIV